MPKKWWSSQSHEAVADHIGVDRILGKYDLDAALSVVTKLHPKSDEEVTVNDALGSGAGSHHAEGVRVSLLQFYVEYLRHYNAKASPREQVALPALVKLDKWGRSVKEPTQGKPESVAAYHKMIQEIAEGAKLPEGFIRDSGKFEPRKEPLDGLLPPDDQAGMALLLKNTVLQLNGLNISKTAKVNTFLRAMAFLGSTVSYFDPTEDWFKGLNNQDRLLISTFLVRNAIGTDGWKATEFGPLLAELGAGTRQFILMPFLNEGFGLNLFTQITKVSPEWRR
ncbi:MAG: hypothetical protein EOP06_22005 [Proteobacteria bacterium]|nr:MAG: hypothetical protein EOP06_22005 [Pseudomonadota bacterium]